MVVKCSLHFACTAPFAATMTQSSVAATVTSVAAASLAVVMLTRAVRLRKSFPFVALKGSKRSVPPPRASQVGVEAVAISVGFLVVLLV